MAPFTDSATKRRYEEQFAIIRKMPAPIPEDERHKFSVENLKLGGFLKFEGKIYFVAGMNAYEKQRLRWPELVLYCLQDGTTRYLEWEGGDEVSVFVSLKKLTFKDVGIKGKEELWKISNEEEGVVLHEGQRFSYDDDSAVKFFREAKGRGTPFHQYLFASDDEQMFICIEEWGDEDEGYEHNAILSGKVNPDAIDVLSTGGNNG